MKLEIRISGERPAEGICTSTVSLDGEYLGEIVRISNVSFMARCRGESKQCQTIGDAVDWMTEGKIPRGTLVGARGEITKSMPWAGTFDSMRFRVQCPKCGLKDSRRIERETVVGLVLVTCRCGESFVV